MLSTAPEAKSDEVAKGLGYIGNERRRAGGCDFGLSESLSSTRLTSGWERWDNVLRRAAAASSASIRCILSSRWAVRGLTSTSSNVQDLRSREQRAQDGLPVHFY